MNSATGGLATIHYRESEWRIMANAQVEAAGGVHSDTLSLTILGDSTGFSERRLLPACCSSGPSAVTSLEGSYPRCVLLALRYALL